MPDLSEQLHELRDVGVRQLPERGDPGDRRIGAIIEKATTGKRSRRPAWTRHRVRVGGFAVPSIAVLAVVATAAAATTAAVATFSALNVFQADPQGLKDNGDIEAVLPATVRQVATVTIPDYGKVAAWGATTKPGGFCFALKLPDGTWGGYPQPRTVPTANGWAGGSVPGCFQTQQQQALKYDKVLAPGHKASVTTGQYVIPTPVEAWDNLVRNKAGKTYLIYVGFVEVKGTATKVYDSATHVSATVNRDGYYVLAEPAPLVPAPAHLPSGAPRKVICAGCDERDLEVLNAAGQRLRPDYSWGTMLDGYRPGPSQGTNQP